MRRTRRLTFAPEARGAAGFAKIPQGVEYRCVGRIHEVVPYSRLVYTYAWVEQGDRGPDTMVTLSFAEVTAFQTKLTIHQRPFRNRVERDTYRVAWEQTLDRFAACLRESQEALSTAGVGLAAE